MNEKVALAEALPQTSAAAAAVYGVIHILQLKKGRMARICDVPGCVARMWGLRELAVTLWMDEEIQARTGEEWRLALNATGSISMHLAWFRCKPLILNKFGLTNVTGVI